MCYVIYNICLINLSLIFYDYEMYTIFLFYHTVKIIKIQIWVNKPIIHFYYYFYFRTHRKK